VIARVPLDEGSLAGTLTLGSRWPEARLAEQLLRPGEPRGDDPAGRGDQVAGAEGQTMAQLALRFILSSPDVTTVIPGMRSVEHLAANLAASAAGPLPRTGRRAARASLGPSAIGAGRCRRRAVRSARCLDPAGLPTRRVGLAPSSPAGRSAPSSSGCSARRSAATWPGYDVVTDSISSMVHAPLRWLQVACVRDRRAADARLGGRGGAGIGSSPRDRTVVRVVFTVQAAIALAFALLPDRCRRRSGDARRRAPSRHLLRLRGRDARFARPP